MRYSKQKYIFDRVEEKPEDRLQTDAFINVGYAVYNLVLTFLAVLHWGKNDPLYYIAGVVGIIFLIPIFYAVFVIKRYNLPHIVIFGVLSIVLGLLSLLMMLDDWSTGWIIVLSIVDIGYFLRGYYDTHAHAIFGRGTKMQYGKYDHLYQKTKNESAMAQRIERIEAQDWKTGYFILMGSFLLGMTVVAAMIKLETLTLFKATYGESGRFIANVAGCILLLVIWLKDIIKGIKYLIYKIKEEIGDY